MTGCFGCAGSSGSRESDGRIARIRLKGLKDASRDGGGSGRRVSLTGSHFCHTPTSTPPISHTLLSTHLSPSRILATLTPLVTANFPPAALLRHFVTHALRLALELVGLQVLDTDPGELNHDGVERSRSGGRSASRTRRCRGRRPPCRKDDDQSRGEARTEAFDQWILWQDARGGCGRGHGKATHRRRRRRRTDGTGTHFSHMSHAPFPHISEIEFFFRPPLSPRSSPRHQRRQLEDRNRRSSSRRCQR